MFDAEGLIEDAPGDLVVGLRCQEFSKLIQRYGNLVCLGHGASNAKLDCILGLGLERKRRDKGHTQRESTDQSCHGDLFLSVERESPRTCGGSLAMVHIPHAELRFEGPAPPTRRRCY